MARPSTFEGFIIYDVPGEVQWYRDILMKAGLSKHSIESYSWALANFLKQYSGNMSPENLIEYKQSLIQGGEPQTVNARISGLNRYLKEKDIEYRLAQVKIVNEQFNDRVISLQDYIYLKRRLKEDDNLYDYFLVWALGCTGARVSEVVQLKVENIQAGMFRIYGKGTKARTIFLSKQFCAECIQWVNTREANSEYVFFAKSGSISTSTTEVRVKRLAYKYKMDPEVIYPHSFRHMFAKEFHKRNNDLVILKDIMGHADIETTLLYCKPSLDEILVQYNCIVDW